MSFRTSQGWHQGQVMRSVKGMSFPTNLVTRTLTPCSLIPLPGYFFGLYRHRVLLAIIVVAVRVAPIMVPWKILNRLFTLGRIVQYRTPYVSNKPHSDARISATAVQRKRKAAAAFVTVCILVTCPSLVEGDRETGCAQSMGRGSRRVNLPSRHHFTVRSFIYLSIFDSDIEC